MRKWVKDCRDSNVIPIPTTVVPVIKPDSIKVQLKEFAKIILGKPTFQKRLEGLLAYNDWVRSFAREEKVSVLDLESTLRYSETDRRLRAELHSGDGLHLSLNAYFLLDQKVIPSLEIAFSNR
jgi:hypothetical protein